MSLASSSTTHTIIKRALLTSTLSTRAFRPIVPTAATRPQPLLHLSTTHTKPPFHQQTRLFTATMGKGGVHNLASKKEFDEALGDKGLMVLDCFATWCGPCKVIAPQVVKFSEKYDDARFFKLDVDEVPDVAQELSVRAMPTFMLFKDGEKVGEVVGANPAALEKAIEQHK